MDGGKVKYPARTNYEKIPNGKFDNAEEILKRKLEREARQEQTKRRLSK